MADITGDDGKKITSEAASWKGTKYALVGEKSQKGSSGDCSGTTFKIYSAPAVGFKYEYRSTQFFAVYAAQSKLFRLLEADEPKQDGDLLLWSHHMAIYSSFTSALERPFATTLRPGKNGKTWTQVNDMWTASHPDTPTNPSIPYGPAAMKYWFPDDPPDVYRYVRSAS
jgi:hypothetical protein